MNYNYFFLKKHIFKQRYHKPTYVSNIKLRFGFLGLISMKRQFFEFVYFRFVKKLIRRKYCKSYTRFCTSKFWVFIKPNFILSAKSKNARMGAGVGILIRLICQLYKYFSLIEFVGFSYLALRKISSYLNFKCNLCLLSYKS